VLVGGHWRGACLDDVAFAHDAAYMAVTREPQHGPRQRVAERCQRLPFLVRYLVAAACRLIPRERHRQEDDFESGRRLLQTLFEPRRLREAEARPVRQFVAIEPELGRDVVAVAAAVAQEEVDATRAPALIAVVWPTRVRKQLSRGLRGR